MADGATESNVEVGGWGPAAISCRLSGLTYGLQGWRRFAAASGCGAVSVLAFAPFFLSPVLFVTLPALIWLMDRAIADAEAAGPYRPSSGKRKAVSAALIGWWFGFGFFLAGLFWIGEAFLVEADRFAWALPIAVTLLPAGLALFYAAAAGAAALFWLPGLQRVAVLALTVSGAEWLRGHILTGFPWNVLGYSLTSPLPLMQTVSIFGIYGLTLFAVMIFASPLVTLAHSPGSASGWRSTLSALSVAAVPLGLAWGYGTLRLAEDSVPPVDGVRLRLVQPSIPQRDKWRPEKQRDIFIDHLVLSQTAPDGQRDQLAGITHVIWPEAAMPFLPLQTPEALRAIGDLLPSGTALISGALRVEDEVKEGVARRRGFNTLLAFNADGDPTARYDKIHLVPFGEYLPLQTFLESIGIEQLTRWRGGFTPGPQPRPLFRVPGFPPVAPLICYEAIFPAAVVQGGERPQALLNVTNDGWFGNTTGPRQHFQQARVRAVEEGLPLLRVANNGISGVVDAQGRVLARLELNVRGVIDTDLPAPRAPTIYSQYGDYIFGFCWVAAAAILLAIARCGKRATLPQA